MARLLLALTGALVLPVLTAAPAYAVDNVICVNSSTGCSQTVATIPLAIAAAAGNGLDDTILVGPGTYTDGPYTLDGTANGVTLRGAGAGSTFLTLPPSAASQDYVSSQGAVLEDFTITMASATSENDHGLSIGGGSKVVGVTVEGTGLSDATGAVSLDSQLSNVTISLPGTNRGVASTGGTALTDSTVTAGFGFVASSDPGNPEDLSRVTIQASTWGVSLDGGLINIDNSLIRITAPTGGVGLLAADFNNGTTAKTINADHVTVVGGGLGSVGVGSVANAPGAKQTSLVTLDDSIVRGQNSSLEVVATNDGAQGGDSDAKILVQYSSYDAAATSVNLGANGTGGLFVGAGALNDPDPLFVDAVAGDFRLSPTSPLIDVGNPAAGGSATDRDGTPRVVDGDLDSVAVRDLGAYEWHDTTPPETLLLTGPSGFVNDTTPTFTFSSEVGATFECKVDGGSYSVCASPFTTAVGPGAHTFSVRAVDAALIADASPASRSFTVDTVVPTTKLVRKPGKIVSAPKAKFTFSTNEPTATFECKVDKKTFKKCLSPAKIKVKPGKHTFYVRAVDAAGNVDATPAKYRFTKV